MFLITGGFICFCKYKMKNLPNGKHKILNLLKYKYFLKIDVV